jgi:hypothetical protein
MAMYHYMTGITNWTKVLGNPVPNYNRDGNEWTFDFTPDAAGVALIKELGIADKMRNKDDIRGKFITLKQREKQANGKNNDPITVVDARNRVWDPDVKIGNGSTVEVKFKVVDYGKGKPKGVYPQAIRILDLVPYERQEFAPLPEDSEYVQKLAETFPENDEEVMEDVEPEVDPLNVDDKD